MIKLQLFFLALGFYTRLPCPRNLNYDLLPQAAVFLPLIGWITGLICAITFAAADRLWPVSTAVILALVAGVLATGAFHEDGFADVCDGFGGGWQREQVLAIMKDSRVGAYAALGLILLFALKISLLSSFPAERIPLILVAAHSLSRFCPLLIMRNYRYARNADSKSAAAVYQPGNTALSLAALTAMAPCLLLPGLAWLVAAPIVAVNWLLGRYFNHRIGGYTGDCLGTSQQVAEIVFYLSLEALWTFT